MLGLDSCKVSLLKAYSKVRNHKSVMNMSAHLGDLLMIMYLCIFRYMLVCSRCIYMASSHYVAIMQSLGFVSMITDFRVL